MSDMPGMFGCMVFNDGAMRQRLPRDSYKNFKRVLHEGRPLDRALANVIANAMKDWAIEKGATHFTHWFQPMTGITAEKHDSFITPCGDSVIMEFSGKELIKGEPDASSFPSGGLRATFEARGYTNWDPTSYAFIKDGTLCIPTAFCSYTGHALDKKTPLLRSMEAINLQALRILKLFGREDVGVNTTVGPEQEYFLIDKSDFDARPDLIYTGRTLFGARPPKGQELGDHYFGVIKPRVSAFMREIDEELWKLGILAKTEHNEAAPSQHELAPIYTTTNIATDHNQLTMEVMRRVAARHGLVCLLHEKPFAGVNGSGKHNNWSIATDTGVNLLEPGDNPMDNAQFLLFFCAVMKAVDVHQDLIRISAASAGNDHRLGSNEAPPAIISMFIGEDLTEVLDALESKRSYTNRERPYMDIGVDVMPQFRRDATDRNRTSPFAFTGNKFEFRMVGSSFSVAEPNIVLNTSVADVLMEFADRLERAEDFNVELNRIIRATIREHKRIIFNGNNYSDEWTEEAARRGLLNMKNSVDAISHFADEKNVNLFARHGVYSELELKSRQEILLEGYAKIIHIEALTMLDMVTKDILPAVLKYSGFLADNAVTKAKLGIKDTVEAEMAARLSAQSRSIMDRYERLNDAVLSAQDAHGGNDRANYYCYTIVPLMQELRAAVDETELMIGSGDWPYPTYGDILFGV